MFSSYLSNNKALYILYFFSILCILIIGVYLRSCDISYNFDGDEVFSVSLAGREFREMILGALGDKPHPPLYNILLHYWMCLFGESEISARTLSIICSAIFLLFAVLLFSRHLTKCATIGCVSLLSWSPYFVYYGQQARPYSLLALLISLNVYSFSKLLEYNNKTWICLWAIICVFLVYTQYLATLIIFVQIGYAFYILKENRGMISTLGILSVVSVAPWMLWSMSAALVAGNDLVPEISWMKPPSLYDIAGFYISIFGNNPWLRAYWIFSLIIVLGLVFLYKYLKSNYKPKHCIYYLFLCVGLPLCVFVESSIGPKPIFATRQLIGSAYIFVLFIGFCINPLTSKKSTIIISLLLLWVVLGIPDALPRHKNPPWRRIAEEIDDKYDNNRVVVLEDWVKIPLSYYRKKGTVLLWDECPEEQREKGVLVLSRTFMPIRNCALIDSNDISSINTWKWGRYQDRSDDLMLTLDMVRKE